MKNKFIDLKQRDNTLAGFYRGIVEDRNDPEKMGRCKIRVFGIHTDTKIKTPTEGVTTDDLPWAEPAISSIEGGVSGFGLWSVPLQGSQVLVYFEECNMMKPMYMASLPGRSEESSKGKSKIGFWDPDEKYPIDSKSFPHEPNQKGDNDTHKLAMSEGISDTIVQNKKDKKDKSIQTSIDGTWDEPDPYYNAKYPDNVVLAMHSGITIEVDNTPGSERVHVYHPSNSYIEIGPAGDIIIRNAKDKFEIVDKNKKIKVGENLDQTVEGDYTNNIKGSQTDKIHINKKETIIGNKEENVNGNKEVQIDGTENKNLGGTYNLNASTINLNC